MKHILQLLAATLVLLSACDHKNKERQEFETAKLRLSEKELIAEIDSNSVQTDFKISDKVALCQLFNEFILRGEGMNENRLWALKNRISLRASVMEDELPPEFNSLMHRFEKQDGEHLQALVNGMWNDEKQRFKEKLVRDDANEHARINRASAQKLKPDSK